MPSWSRLWSQGRVALFSYLSRQRCQWWSWLHGKSLAGKASLQRPYDRQITTPMQLFQWVSQEIQGITFEYCSIKEHKEEEQRLQDRFQNTNYKVQHVVLFPSPKIPFELRRIPFQMISKIKKLPRKPLWKHHQGLLPVYVIVNGGSLMF